MRCSTKPTALEVIVTDSVVEALALESNLIKQRAPKYNILLRDDKSYPYLQLTVGEAFPRLLVARRVEKDAHAYYGPFLPAKLARRTITLSQRLFGLRSCNEVITGQRGRPCLEYDIKRCIAPCVEALCSPEEYRRAVADARLFLEGRARRAGRRSRRPDARRRRRPSASSRRRTCATPIRTIETLRDRQQKMATPGLGDRDAFGVKLGSAGAVVQVFQMRGGRVVERVELTGERGRGRGRRARRRSSRRRVQQFYELQTAPPEVHVPVALGGRRAARAVAVGARRPPRAAGRAAPRRQARACSISPPATPRIAYADARWASSGVSQAEALDTLRVVLQLPATAAPHRVLRHLDDPGQRDRGLDGRLRGRADAAGRVSEVPRFAGYRLQATAQARGLGLKPVRPQPEP